MEVKVRVGKKRAIYIPKRVAENLGIREGDVLKLRVSGDKIVLEKVGDPLELAIFGKKFAKISSVEVEEVSVREQERGFKGSA